MTPEIPKWSKLSHVTGAYLPLYINNEGKSHVWMCTNIICAFLVNNTQTHTNLIWTKIFLVKPGGPGTWVGPDIPRSTWLSKYMTKCAFIDVSKQGRKLCLFMPEMLPSTQRILSSSIILYEWLYGLVRAPFTKHLHTQVSLHLSGWESDSPSLKKHKELFMAFEVLGIFSGEHT